MTKEEREQEIAQLHGCIERLAALKNQKLTLDVLTDVELNKAERIMKRMRLMKHTEGLYMIERRKASTRLIFDQQRAERLLKDVPPSKYKRKVKVPAGICFREGKIELKFNKKSQSLCRKFGGSHPTDEDQ